MALKDNLQSYRNTKRKTWKAKSYETKLESGKIEMKDGKKEKLKGQMKNPKCNIESKTVIKQLTFSCFILMIQSFNDSII